MKFLLSSILVVSLVAMIFSLGNCQLNYILFGVFGASALILGNC